MAADTHPSFAIPERPNRKYSRRGVEYVGKTVFTVSPSRPYEDAELTSLIESVLEQSLYRYGDWFDLPMPLYLVHDDQTGDTFRVAIRDGRVELHVLPGTEPAGLRAFYDRLEAASDTDWSVTCQTD